MKKTMFLAAAASLALPLVAFAGPMKAGKWEVTIETPRGNQTITRCVTKEEADNPQPPKRTDCTVDSYKVEGHTVSWKVSCPKSGSTGEGKTTYDGNTFKGETHFKMGDREITQHSTGKFLGPCDEK